MSRSESLLDLQRIDERISHLGSEAASLQATLAGDPELDSLRSAESKRAAEVAAVSAKASAVEKEVAELTKKAQQITRKLYDGSVHNPVDLLTLQRELTGVQERVSATSDGMLELMEETEAAEAALLSAREAVSSREADREAAEGTHRSRLADVEAAIAEATVERSDRVADITPSDIAIYTRVAAKHTPAVVRMAGDSCAGCHLPLSPKETHAVRTETEELVQCSNCDRILAP